MKKKLLFLLIPIAGLLLFLFNRERAQDRPAMRVSVVMSGDARLDKLKGLKKGLSDLGYIDGENINLEIYNGENDLKKMKQMVDDLVPTRPDIIVALGGREVKKSKKATAGTGIPVVFIGADNTVVRGIVRSMKSSGSNLTGIESNFTGLIPKRMELLSRILPHAKKIMVFFLPIASMKKVALGVTREEIAAQAASKLGIETILVPIKNIKELGPYAKNLKEGDADAIFLVPSAPILTALPDLLAPAAYKAKIPIIGMDRNLIYPGVLANYGPGLLEMGHQGARLVDKVLRGVAPESIPIELPAIVDLVINMKTANHFGLNISDSVLALAAHVIRNGYYDKE